MNRLFSISLKGNKLHLKSEAGVAEVCKGCSGQRLCQESFNMIDPDIEDIKIRMNVIKHKILVMSGLQANIF